MGNSQTFTQVVSVCLFSSLTANANTVLFDISMSDFFSTDFQAKGGFGSYTETTIMTPFADQCGYLGKQLKLEQSATRSGPEFVMTADEDCWSRDAAGSLRIKIKDCWNTGQYFYISVNDAESDYQTYKTKPLRGACVHSNEAGRPEYNCAGDMGQKCGLGLFGSETVAGSKTNLCARSSGILSDACASWRGTIRDSCRGDDMDIAFSTITMMKLTMLSSAVPAVPECLPFNTQCAASGSSAASAPAPIAGPVVRLDPEGAAMSTLYGQDYVASNCLDSTTLNPWGSAPAMCHSDSGGSSDQWIQFDMGEAVTVDHLVITNRPGGCGSRLGCGSTCGDVAACAGFEVTVGDVACANLDDADACDQNPVCYSSGPVDTTGQDPTVDCGATGRYVTLRLPGASRVINLHEVAVFGTAEPVVRLTPIAGAMNTLYGQDYVASNCFESTTLNKWGSQAAMCHSDSGGSSDAWIQFDMGEAVTVDHLVIENRPDACASRLGCVEGSQCAASSVCPGFEVTVGDVACANLDDADACDQNPVCASSAADTTGQNTLTVDCAGAGRYVTLRLPGASRVVNLLEMAVFGKSAPTIEAPAGGSSCGSCGASAPGAGVPISQMLPVSGALSSLYGGADWAASMCFDTTTLNQWGSPSWCVTGNKGTETNTWVQFDMGESIVLDHLRIKNRGFFSGTDSCSSHLGCSGACGSAACAGGFEVYVGDTACAEGSEMSESCDSDNLCYASGPVDTNGVYELSVDCAAQHAGRYVTLRLPGAGRVVNLQEVAIFGGPNRPPLKRLTPQAGALSSLYGNWNWAASMCFDTTTLNQWGAPSWCVTGNTGHEAHTWVQFDMGAEVAVDHLELKNRGFFSGTDQCSSRLGCENNASVCSNTASCPGFEVRVGNTACAEGSQAACDTDPVCHTSGPIDTTGVYELAADCAGAPRGRYVTLLLPGPGRVVNLQEMAVFGYDDASSCPTTGFGEIGNGFCSSDGVNKNMYFERDTDNADTMTTQEIIDACAADAMGVAEAQAFGVSLAGNDLGTCYLYPNYDPGFSNGHSCTKTGSWDSGVGTVTQKLVGCPPDSPSGGVYSTGSWQFIKTATSTTGPVTGTAVGGSPVEGLWSTKCYTFTSSRISVSTSMKLAGAAGRRLRQQGAGSGAGSGLSERARLMSIADVATCALTKTLGADCGSAKLGAAYVVGDLLRMEHYIAAESTAAAGALVARLDAPSFLQSFAGNVGQASGEAVAVQSATAAVTFQVNDPTPAPTPSPVATPAPTPSPVVTLAPTPAPVSTTPAPVDPAVPATTPSPVAAGTPAPTGDDGEDETVTDEDGMITIQVVKENRKIGTAVALMIVVFLVICIGFCWAFKRQSDLSKEVDRLNKANNNQQQEV